MLIQMKIVHTAILLICLITLTVAKSSIQSIRPNVSDIVYSNGGNFTIQHAKEDERENSLSQNNTSMTKSPIEHLESKILTQDVNSSSKLENATNSNGYETVQNGSLMKPKGNVNGVREGNHSNAEIRENKTTTIGNLLERKGVISVSASKDPEAKNDGNIMEAKGGRKCSMPPLQRNDGMSQVRNDREFLECVMGEDVPSKKENKEHHGGLNSESASTETGDKELYERQKKYYVSTKKDDKEIHKGLKKEVFTKEEDKEIHEELPTTAMRGLPKKPNDKDELEVTPKEAEEVDDDKESTLRMIPIFPPLPIMFRAFLPLAFPPLDRIAVEPVPPPAIHISDRLPFHEAETPNTSSEIKQDGKEHLHSSQQAQSAMKSLISNILGDMFRFDSPPRALDSPDTAEKSSDLKNAESKEDSKMVDLQGQQFLMKSKTSHLLGNNGRFILRFISLRPLERDLHSGTDEGQHFEHEKKGKPPTTAETKIETVSEGKSSLDPISSPELKNKSEIEDKGSAGQTNIQIRRKLVESVDASATQPLGISDVGSGNYLKANSSSISSGSHHVRNREDPELTDMNSNLSSSERSVFDPLRVEESQLKLIQYYRSFLNPVIPSFNENSSNGMSGEKSQSMISRLKDVPLEGDVSVAPSVDKVFSSIGIGASLSDTSAEISSSDVNDKEVLPSRDNLEKISSLSNSVEKVTAKFEKESSKQSMESEVASIEKVPTSITNGVKTSPSVASVEKVLPSVANASKKSPMFVKGDDQPYENETSYPKPIFFETRSSFLNSSNKSNVVDGVPSSKVYSKDQKVSAIVGLTNERENISKDITVPLKKVNLSEIGLNTDFRVSEGFALSSPSESSLKESGTKPILMNNGNLDVAFKGIVDKHSEGKSQSQGNDSQNMNLTASSAKKGDILLEKRKKKNYAFPPSTECMRRKNCHRKKVESDDSDSEED